METFEAVLKLLGGLGVFMFGMQTMSHGLESSAGKSMQRLFGKISNNRFMGVGVGTAVTAIIQSSSATSVMVIGFVNAGLMTLSQATSILMGANIGTTITGIIVSLKSLPIAPIFMALSAVGVFMAMFSRSDKIKRIGNILTGLGLIFVGLAFMSSALNNDGLKGFFSGIFMVVSNPILLILVGLVATAVLQSSSVVTSIIITLVAADSGSAALPVMSALFLVLGSNIGTCVSALLASIGTNKNAKRTALIMIGFNVFGVLVFAPIVMIFGNQVVAVLDFLGGGNPTIMVAFFHVFFNVLTMLILIGFVKYIVMLSEKIITDKQGIVGEDRLYYLDDRILQSPPIAVAQTVKEVINMTDIVETNFIKSMENVLNGNTENSAEIAKRERQINYLNKATTNYLVKISSLNLSESNEKIIGSLHHVISDLERIGDHAENFDEIAREMADNDLKFSEDAVAELTEMTNRTKQLFTIAKEIFKSRKTAMLPDVNQLEESIDAMVKTLEENHIKRLHKGACTVESGVSFYSTITNLERVADHLTNIAYSVTPRTIQSSKGGAGTKKVAPKKPAAKKTEPKKPAEKT